MPAERSRADVATTSLSRVMTDCLIGTGGARSLASVVSASLTTRGTLSHCLCSLFFLCSLSRSSVISLLPHFVCRPESLSLFLLLFFIYFLISLSLSLSLSLPVVGYCGR